MKYLKFWQKAVLFFIYLTLAIVYSIWLGTVIQKIQL